MDYTLGPEAIKQLRQLVKNDVLRAVRAERVTPQHTPVGQTIYLAKTGAGGIPALSGTTPGTAEVTVQRINNDDEIEVATNTNDDPITVTAYNVSSGAVAANTYIHLKQEVSSGKLLVDFEDCG